MVRAEAAGREVTWWVTTWVLYKVQRAGPLSTWPVVSARTGCRETGGAMGQITAVATKVQNVGGVTHWVHVKLATTDTGRRAGVGGLTQQKAGLVWVEGQVRAMVEMPRE